MVIDVSPVQPLNALLAISVIPSGMVIDVNPAQQVNASYPISVTLPGMEIDINPLLADERDVVAVDARILIEK